MPPKRNKENQGLPARWQFKHSAYYYRVPIGLESLWDGKTIFRLGKTLPESYKVWADRVNADDKATTIAQLLDRYLLEVVPTKAISTRDTNALFVKQLRAVFGALPLTAIKPKHVYQYVDKRSKKVINASGKVTGGKTIAHREIEVLSHAFTKAVQWGYLDKHPFKGEVRLEGEKARDRYIEDWEILECLSLDSKRKKGSVDMIHAYIRIKLMTGMARSDLLRITMSDIQEDGIHIQRHKTRDSSGKRTLYNWSDDLRKYIDQAKAARPALSAFLFCNKFGKGYIDEETGKSDGWDSMWQRYMARVLAETKVTVKFTEHDLRAKCASDATTLEHARALLSHADSRTTDAIYRRKPEAVDPLKSIG